MVGPINEDLWTRHERLVARLKDKLFGKWTMEQYRFTTCEVVGPINGFVWESLGGLSLSYTNPNGVGVEFEIRHDNDMQFTIFILQKKPAFTFGYRTCTFGSLDSRLMELAKEYWAKDRLVMGVGK